jgi:hypothetical protein
MAAPARGVNAYHKDKKEWSYTTARAMGCKIRRQVHRWRRLHYCEVLQQHQGVLELTGSDRDIG